MVDRIRVGQEGFALVVADGGQLIVHGDPDQKPRVAAAENLSGHELVMAVAALRARGRLDGGRPASLDVNLVIEHLDATAGSCWRSRRRSPHPSGRSSSSSR